MTRRAGPTRRGIALIEAVMSMVVLSVALVAALNTLGASRLGQRWNADHLRGLSLASDLMTEIMEKSYADPNEVPLFGPETSELLVGRAAFDDVDDYNGYQDSPPVDRAGNAIAGLSGWRRDVTVAFVNASDLTKSVLLDGGIKRITVTVRRNGQLIAQLTAVRTAAAPN